ncbi:MAG: DUF397 domain-containing protein [Candidatus Dormibacteraceae bacterium]
MTLLDTGWFKSSRSSAGNDSCVEVRITTNQIGIRDSKSPDAGSFSIAADAWTELLTDLKRS